MGSKFKLTVCKWCCHVFLFCFYYYNLNSIRSFTNLFCSVWHYVFCRLFCFYDYNLNSIRAFKKPVLFCLALCFLQALLCIITVALFIWPFCFIHVLYRCILSVVIIYFVWAFPHRFPRFMYCIHIYCLLKMSVSHFCRDKSSPVCFHNWWGKSLLLACIYSPAS